MSNLKEALLKVVTSKGAFDSEYAVQIHSFDGREVSLFTDKQNVESSADGKSFMKVYVLTSKPSEGKERLLLPSEAFETSSRWLDVNQDDVKECIAP